MVDLVVDENLEAMMRARSDDDAADARGAWTSLSEVVVIRRSGAMATSLMRLGRTPMDAASASVRHQDRSSAAHP